ncbi:MAG: hypothetical protein KBD62_32265 [Kofleriaceae bacterium]|nr:hypothetical protein [Kofleriaceae bacterium]
MPVKAPRPRSIPKVATADVMTPFAPSADGTKDTARAIDAIARNLDALGGPVRNVVAHPTLRDQIGEVWLVQGDNWISHGLGRVPRFVYLTVVDDAPPSGFRWNWQRQTPRSADARRVDVFAVVSGSTAGTGGGELGGGIGSRPTGAVRALVRLE